MNQTLFAVECSSVGNDQLRKFQNKLGVSRVKSGNFGHQVN